MKDFDFNNWNTTGAFSSSKKGSMTKFTKKQKIIAATSLVAVIALILFFCIRGCSSSRSSKSARDNTLSLVQMYLDRGEYDRALDKLDELLIKNGKEQDIIDLMDKIIAAKNAASSENGANVTVEVDTEGLSSVIDSMRSEMVKNNENMKKQLDKTNAEAEKDRKEMALLLKQQQKQAEQEKVRQEEERNRQKALEEQRKKDEIARKAAEEELAKKNAALKKEIAAVNDEIQQGKTALNSGNIDSALLHFDSAIKKLPVSEGEPGFSATKYSEMANLLYSAEQTASSDSDKKRLHQTAVDYAQNAVAKNPKDGPSQFILGMDAMDSKDYQKALDCFNKAVAAEGNNYLYYYNLGRVQYMMKKFTEAKSSFTTASQLNTSFAAARYNLGLTNLKVNDSKSALAEFRRAHDIDSRYERAYLEEARVLVRLSDYSGAVTAYLNVIKLNNTNRAALQELGSVYYQMKKYSDAESSFRKSLALLPAGTEDPLTYYNLSTVLFEQGKSVDALTYAAKAYNSNSIIKDASSRANIIYNYALLCDKTGKESEAIVTYSEVLQIKPNHLKTLINLGVVYMKSNPPEVDTALSLFTKAYSIDKNNFEVNNNLGSAYLAKKDYKNAILYFQNALKIEPSNNEVRYNLAQAFASDAQFDNAKVTYTELLKLSPDYWDGYIELGKVCMALNDNSSAEKYLVFVQTKNPSFRKQEVETLLNSISSSNAK